MKYSTPLNESENEIQNDINESKEEQYKQKINKFNSQQNDIKNNNNNNESFLLYINNFLEIYKPGAILDRMDLELISIKFLLCFCSILIFIKFLFSNEFKLFYLFILILLPFCSFVLINKIIIVNYLGELSFLDIYNNILKDYIKLFLISIFPLIFFQYLTLIINQASFIGRSCNILFIFYSTHLAQKFFFDYMKMISINNHEFIIIFLDYIFNFFIVFTIKINNEKNKILFIHLIIFCLISYIINL